MIRKPHERDYNSQNEFEVALEEYRDYLEDKADYDYECYKDSRDIENSH